MWALPKQFSFKDFLKKIKSRQSPGTSAAAFTWQIRTFQTFGILVFEPKIPDSIDSSRCVAVKEISASRISDSCLLGANAIILPCLLTEGHKQLECFQLSRNWKLQSMQLGELQLTKPRWHKKHRLSLLPIVINNTYFQQQQKK